MAPKLIDIHTHLNFPDFDKDKEQVINSALRAGIWLVNVGTDLKTSKESIQLSRDYQGVFAAVGLHPHYMDEGFNKGTYGAMAQNVEVVAIGECGLDYSRTGGRDDWNKKKQKEVFEKHVELASEMGKPLMVHCRDAHKDLLGILKYYLAPEKSIDPFKKSRKDLRGNIHFFSGTLQEAEDYLRLGFMISFAGPITFSTQYDKTIQTVPIDRIMVETDSPFAAPAAYRGKRCEPIYVEEVVKKIAQLRGMTYEEVAEITTQNAIKFFGLN